MCSTISILGACVIAANLSSINVAYEYHKDKQVKAYNGDVHNVGHFYKPERPTFNLKGTVVLDTDTAIRFGYDNGYDSQKMDISRSGSLGVTQYIKLTDNSIQRRKSGTGWSVLVGADIHRTAAVKHTSCRDSVLGTEYYCLNLATITSTNDVIEKANKKASWQHKANITFRYNF